MARKKKITETGPVGLKGVRGTDLYNNLAQASASGDADAAAMLEGLGSKPTPYSYGDTDAYYAPVRDDSSSPWRNLGNSRYDAPYMIGDDVSDINQVRALEESTLAKWGAGLGKGLVLAGTTFLDGTIGLLYGAASVINNIGNDKETGWQTFSRLWDNDVSNGLQQINDFAEEWMPNYQTNEEQEAPWYKNLGTANFWADKVLKNLGFMVGAYYSGGAWNKVLNAGAKGIQALKSAATTTKTLADSYKVAKGIGTMGSRVAGSLLSATNEARIEANQNSSQWKDLEYQKAADAYGIDVGTLKNDPTYANVVGSIEDAGAKVGAIDFFANLPLLAADDFLLFGKLYSRGFSNAKDIAKGVTKAGEKTGWFSRLKKAGKEGLKEEAKEAANVALEGGEYVAKKLSNKDIWKKVLKTGFREGNEELLQQTAANFAGDLYETDSPDAYFKALNNPNAQLEANNFIDSVVKAFAESYGDGDQWEQFAVGAISSLLGMPTLGKVNNSDANTILGKGKSIGWSGGILGEFATARANNEEAQRNVDVMNKVVNKIKSHQRHYAMSNSFTDAMDGFSEKDNKFEYKNAEDNLDFATIQAFSNTNRLDDLKQLVNQDFDNMSAEELGKIAMYTSKQDKDGKPIGGWQTADGKPMATLDEDGNVQISEENQKEMRKKLNEKKEEILKKIEDYGEALQTVRGIGNNSLTDEQNQELAWILWKQAQFPERFKNIVKEGSFEFSQMFTGLRMLEDRILHELKYIVDDTKKTEEDIYKTDENGKKVLTTKKGHFTVDENGKNTKRRKDLEQSLAMVRTVKDFIEQIQTTTSPLHSVSFLKSNPEFEKLLKSESFYDFAHQLSDKTGLDFAKYNKILQDLIDCERLAKASETFNERFREFVSDPMSIIAGREKAAAQSEAKKQAANKMNKRDAVNNAKVSDLVRQADEGEDLDELTSLYDAIEGGGAPKDSEEAKKWQQEGKRKVVEAKAIIDLRNKTEAQLDKLLADGTITQQQYDDAKALLKNSTAKSESVDEFKDLSSFSLNDTQVLTNTEDDSITPEELEEFMNSRLEEAQNALSEAFTAVGQAEEATKNLPDDNVIEEEREPGETGHDGTTKTIPENERLRAQQEAEEAQKAAEEASPVGLVRTVMQSVSQPVTQGLPDRISETVKSLITDDLQNLAQGLYEQKQQGIDVDSAIQALKDTKSMQRLAETLGDENMQKVLEVIKNWWKKDGSVPTKEVETDEPIMDTGEGSIDTDGSLNSADADANIVNTSPSGDLIYWKPATSEVAFGFRRGEQLPFWQIAEREKNSDGSPKYTKEQIARFKAIYEYLKAHNAWNNAFNVKEEDKVEFIIDPELNKAAGEVVILMTVNGKIVGDVASKNDRNFNRQQALKEFVERVTKEYEDWEKTSEGGIFTSKETSKVSKKMVGKVPFADPNVRHTLNEIHTTTDSTGAETQGSFTLGIQMDDTGKMIMTPGRTQSLGATKEESSIIKPLKGRRGQPFLLMPTGSSNRAYMPVPITMPRYTADTANSKLGKAIDEVLQQLVNIKKGKEISFIRSLQELLCIPKMHLYISDEGVVRITVKAANDTSQVLIYEGKPSADMVEQIKEKLYNTPFQISRKYINGKFKDGTDYNSMIGELAVCNLPIGATHTISSWFTVCPITEKGLIKPKNPKTTKNNPFAVDAHYSYYTYTSTTQGTVTVAVSRDNFEIFLYNPTTKKWEPKPQANGYRSNLFRALTYIAVNNLTPDENNLIKTEWGTYNQNTGTFVSESPSDDDGHIQTPTAEDVALGQVVGTFDDSGEFVPTKQVDVTTILNDDKTIDFRKLKTTIDAYLGKLSAALIGKGQRTLGIINKDGKPSEGSVLEHLYNVYTSALESGIKEELKPHLLLAAALHDITKPFRKGQIRSQASAALISTLFGNSVEPIVKFAVKHHLFTLEENQQFSQEDADRIMKDAAGLGIELNDAIDVLLALHSADVLADINETTKSKTKQSTLKKNLEKEISEKRALLEKARDSISQSGSPVYSEIAQSVINEFSPFFKDGGTPIEEAYPSMPKEYIAKLKAAIKENGPLAEEEAKEIANWVNNFKISSAINNINSYWEKVKKEQRDKITKEELSNFKSNLANYFAKIVGPEAAAELGTIFANTNSNSEIIKAMEASPLLKAYVPLQKAIYAIMNDYTNLIKKGPITPPKTDISTTDFQYLAADGKPVTVKVESKRVSLDALKPGDEFLGMGNQRVTFIKTTEDGNYLLEKEGTQILIGPNTSNWKAWYNSKPKVYRIAKTDNSDSPESGPNPNEGGSDSNRDYTVEAGKKGLLSTGAMRTVWSILEDKQKEAILNKPQMKSKQIMTALSLNLRKGEFKKGTDVDAIINGTRNREANQKAAKPINLKKEVRWLATVLPNLTGKDRLKIVESLIKLSNSSKVSSAWGQFRRGVILISKKAARGTLFHEAFHAVVNTLMSNAEVNTMFDEAAKRYGDLNTIALEEKLAEDFRRYVQWEEVPILGKAVRLFRTLKRLVQSIRGKESYLDNLFYRIQRGQFANRTPSEFTVVRNRLNTYDILEQMRSLRQQYEYAVKNKPYNLFAAPYMSEALEHIRTSKTPDVLYTYQHLGRWRLGIIKEKEYIQKMQDLQNLLNKAYYGELSGDIRKSNKALAKQNRYEDERYEEELQEYYKEKYLYSNLDDSSKEYLEQRGITSEEYSNMSLEAQETLMHCKQ